MDGDASFGQLIKRLRRQRGLTQAELAGAVGCAAVTLRKIEAGALRPSHSVATRLCAALELADPDRARVVAAARGEQPPRRSGLPAPPTQLLGRQDAIAQACAIVRGGARLLTLAGPPGVGKTRLGLAIAAELSQPALQPCPYPDGVWFVPLAALSDHELVPSAIAHALAAPPPDIAARDWLTGYLRDRRTLLLLDNLEQVAGCAPMLSELLAAAPGLTLVATSRTVLRLSGEHVVEVAPLAFPPAGPAGPGAPHTIAAYPAVQLFVERAGAAAPRFTLAERNAAAVAAICAELEGLPLAIELAAARMRMFSPATLLARLRDRLGLLEGGSRDLPARQQTLRAAIGWSYDLLAPAEQALLRGLAVFAGGFDLAAAAALLDDSGQQLTLEALGALIDHSLVRVEQGGDEQERYTTLETVRAYALEQLRAQCEEQPARARHAAHYLALAEAAEPHLQGADQRRWFELLEREHGNLRAALAFCLLPAGQPDDCLAELGLRMAGALWLFWQVRGYVGEACEWLDRALARCPSPTPGRARALNGAGLLSCWHGEAGRGEAMLEECIALCRALEDQELLAHALNNYATLMLVRIGDYERAEQLCRASLEQSQALDSPILKGWSTVMLHQIALMRGEHAEAHAHSAAAYALFERAGASRGMGFVLLYQTDVALDQYDDELAEALAARAERLFAQAGDPQGTAQAHMLQGLALLARGRCAAAEQQFLKSLAISRQLGEQAMLSTASLHLGRAAELRGDLDGAQALYATARQAGLDGMSHIKLVLLTIGAARVALLRGDPDAAALAEQAVGTLAAAGLRREAAVAKGLVCLARAGAEPARAAALVAEQLERARACGDAWGACALGRLYGLLLLEAGAPNEAQRVLRAALHTCRALGDTLSLPLQLSAIAEAQRARGRALRAERILALARTACAAVGPGRVIKAAFPLESNCAIIQASAAHSESKSVEVTR